jgi:3-deoxy-D-manno-octulosonic-acid transferase
MSWIAFLLYQGLAALAALVALPVLLMARRGEIRERFGGGPRRHADSIWFHAASLGEFEAALPLIRGWAGDPSRVVVSCTNRVARARIAERLPEGARVRLAPFDLLPLISRASRRERPSCCIFVETEIWPAWLVYARTRGIPVAFVSARISDRSFPRYRRIAFLLRPLLRPVVAIGCRTEEDRRRWIAIGAAPEACHAWGNTKYALGGSGAFGSHPAIRAPFVLVGGSVRAGEEALVRTLSEFAPGRLRLVVVPRHLREMGAWETACFRERIACRRLSHAGIDPDGPPELLGRALREADGNLPPVLLADRIGVLRAIYGVADAAFVGGTWIPLGGHNLFEPAHDGVPVYFGPSIGGVRDAAEAIEKYGGGACVADPGQLATEIRILMEEPEALDRRRAGARRAAESLAGAVARTVEGLRAAGLPPAVRG